MFPELFPTVQPYNRSPHHRYVVPPGAPAKNRARAAKAHMGPWFAAKTLQFPAFDRFARNQGQGLDVSKITGVKDKLKCHPFDWYLEKFRYIYRDGGLLPRKIFQLEATGGTATEPQCLALRSNSWGNAGPPNDHIVLQTCDTKSTRQWWHGSNRRLDGSKRSVARGEDQTENDGCCTGLRSWNCDQCMDWNG